MVVELGWYAYVYMVIVGLGVLLITLLQFLSYRQLKKIESSVVKRLNYNYFKHGYLYDEELPSQEVEDDGEA